MKIILLMLVFITFSCNYEFEKKIGENYFIRHDEGRNNIVISFGIQPVTEAVIDPSIIEVFWNDSFILAKRNPYYYNKNDKNEIEYYIIKKRSLSNIYLTNYQIGPLANSDYNKKVMELDLDISKMKFCNLSKYLKLD